MFVVTKGDTREFLIAGSTQKKIGNENEFGFYLASRFSNQFKGP